MTSVLINIRTTDTADNLGGFTLPPGSSRSERGHNDSYDAYRHALTSAMLTDRLGSQISKGMMDDYERKSPNDAIESNMDFWNNNVGRDEYWNWRGAKERGDTNDSLSKWIYDAVKSGKTINEPLDHRSWQEPAEQDSRGFDYPQSDPFTGMPWPSAISPTIGTRWIQARSARRLMELLKIVSGFLKFRRLRGL